MAAFEADVMNATKEQDKAKRAQEEYARMAQQMQRQFGAQQQAGTPSLGIGTTSGAEDATVQAKTDEFNRRKAAAGSAFELGSKVDTRRSQLSDELSAALKDRKASQEKYSTKQDQDTRESNLNLAEIGQDVKQKVGELNFTLYKSQSDRNMVMNQLKNKGMLESELAKAASDNALKQQDIDNYYAMLEAEARAEYEASIKNADWDFQRSIKKAEQDANNFGRIIESSVDIFSTLMEKVMGAK